jgi:hypothetical protein
VDEPASVETWREHTRPVGPTPAELVKANAMHQARLRTARIESRKWFGLSNSRPVASPVPHMSDYSPQWVGGVEQPYDWAGSGWSSIQSRSTIARGRGRLMR